MTPVDNKRTGIKATQVIFPETENSCFPDFAEPGQIEVKDGYIFLACPGCGGVGAMNVGEQKPGQSPSWGVSKGSLKDVTTLTLHPSIHCVGCCGWHGWLRDGEFVL